MSNFGNTSKSVDTPTAQEAPSPVETTTSASSSMDDDDDLALFKELASN